MPSFRIRKQLLAIGDDFWVEDEDGEKAFKVDGKAFRRRKTFVIETPDGTELAKVVEKKLSLRDTMVIERGGEQVARVQKALLTPVRDKFTVELDAGGELEAKGDLLDHEFTITRDDGSAFAEVTKKRFTVRDTYAVTVEPGQDSVLALAVAICIDAMERD
jgi:uncharacterized protein YxjI